MEIQWAPLIGEYEQKGNTLRFKGGEKEYQGLRSVAIGNFISNKTFTSGTISADVEFTGIDEHTGCQIIIYYNSASRFFVTAGLGHTALYVIRDFQNQWFVHAFSGDKQNLKPNQKYQIQVSVSGSLVTLKVNGVNVLSTRLPYQLQQSQVGIWCMSSSDIIISDFDVKSEASKAFVVMQLTTPYDELFKDVISPICDDYKIKAVRVDEVCGSGLIIADIARQIIEAQLIIAEITPANPNVYYEIGFAHALGKPTILIAEKATELPFDVSPFRVLFYENSISGKKHIEEGLRKHLKAILEKTTP